MEPQTLFSRINELNVLIVGDVMLDRYLSGNVHRVSPEAPVPVVQLTNTENRLGGAANVALNIQSMGATPFLCSVIGDKKDAQLFLDLLPDASICSTGIIQSKDRCTTVKTRVIAANQHLLRIDQEDTFALSAKDAKNLLLTIQSILDTQEIDVILFQDYNKGVLSVEMIRSILLESIKREIPAVVDPKLSNFLEFRNTALFKPNLKEVKDALPFDVTSDLTSLNKASNYLQSKMRNTNTMITLSEKGIYIDDGKTQAILPTQERNIADVCGAGDTVISIAALGIALDLPLEDIAILANLAGGQVCEKVGVVPVDKQQLLEEYKNLLSHSAS